MNTEKYIKEIEKASIMDLEEIIERAANDDTISNCEYCSVYDKAIERALELGY